ncbi:unnamed protein product [Paramecium primaurelia]|uniref:TNFR-Cys domain-containing protein n=1 Tax=Paramecium primaurelia TaxID=5886 RepID=A0A8S1NN19_PARPR|nr:unnamed protein product [Paramecium primaurelia]
MLQHAQPVLVDISLRELSAHNVLKSVLFAMDLHLLNVQVANNHIILREQHANVNPLYQLFFLDCPVKCQSTCQFLDTSVKCDTCASGYFGDTCEQCSSTCKTCVDLATTCTSCNTGYYLNGQACNQCALHCVTCEDGTGYCLSCDSGYMVDEFHKCATCSNCTCSNGQYYDSSQSMCKGCDQSCTMCSGIKSNCQACSNGFYLDSSTCKNCVAPCNICTASDICSNCNSGYYLDNNTCLPCQSPCVNCLLGGNTNCSLCSTGYYLNGSICETCDSACKKCSTTSINCSECQIGYYLDGSICSKCSNNCNACASETQCTSCDAGYELVDGQCIACGFNQYYLNLKCLSCQSPCNSCEQTPSQCTSCINEYYLSGQQCFQCIQPCINCTSQIECLSCISGKYLSNKTCLNCEYPCSSCTASGNSNCQSCQSGYYLENSQCISCSTTLSSCLICSSKLTCITCDSTHYLNNGQCLLCSSTCKSCSDQFTCTSCIETQFLENNTCKSCQSPCLNCITNSTNCLSCVDSYYLSQNSCIKCTSPCQNCLNGSTCLSCVAGYYFSDGLCSKCDNACQLCSGSATQCQLCQSGYYLSGSSCISCVSPCLTCSSELSCNSCISTSYYYSNNSCLTCLTPCSTCSGETSCLSCKNGYYLDQISCLQCISPCQNCTSLQICNSCVDTYYLNGTVCSKCPVKCKDICNLVNSQVQCESCADGFYSSNSDCVQCSTSCKTCQNTDTQCTSCFTGKYLSNSQCLTCSTNCMECEANSGNCTLCSSGYSINAFYQCAQCSTCNCPDGQYYDQSQNKCFGCEAKCSSCFGGMISQCTSCINGYYIQDSTCTLCQTPCINCTSAISCLSCISTTYLSGTSCLTCQSPCIKCQSADNTNCQECISGYYLIGTVCTQCDSKCKTCTTSSTCQSCADGYYLNGTTCVQCPIGCTSCINDSTCTGCSSDYYLDGICKQCSLGQFISNNSCSQCQSPCFSCVTTASNCLSCIDYYYKPANLNTCQQCVSPCKLCSSDVNCLSCQSGYYYTSSNNSCTTCSSPCQTCQTVGNTNCQSCVTGFYLDGSICRDCTQLSYCLECSNSTICTKCDSTHYVSNGQCLTCQPRCDTCNNSATCNSCLSGKYLNSLNTCSTCQSPCLTCSGTDGLTCSSCENKYYLNVSTCTQCVSPCLTCTTAVSCSSCVDGTYLNGQECLSCNFACTKCSGFASTCSSCTAGYYLSGTSCLICTSPCGTCVDTSTKCLSCNTLTKYLDNNACLNCVQPCQTCSNAAYCLSCISTYYLTAQNTCSQCVSPCVTCTTQTSCLSCIDGYYLSGTQCLICDSNCRTCWNRADYCMTCTQRQYLTTENKCAACTSPCSSCVNSATSCTSCLDLFYYEANSCKRCISPCWTCDSANICKLCLSGKYYDQTQKYCLDCDKTSCVTCTGTATTCLSCASGKYLENNTCKTCDPKCIACTSLTTCQSCSVGYYYNGSECLACTLPCIECNSGSICTKCQNDLYKLSLSQCISCSLPCRTCDQDVCKSCVNKYYFDSAEIDTTKKCKLCISPCDQCTSSSSCTTCISGFYLDGTSCLKCTNNCNTCETATKCFTCVSNSFYLTTSNTCLTCSNMDAACLTCSALNRCLTCKDGFFIYNLTQNGVTTSTCQACSVKCSSCSQSLSQCSRCAGNRQGTPQCTTCPYGFFDSGLLNCEQCNTKFCITCSGSAKNCSICANQRIQPPTCFCRPGTYTSGDDCIQCMANCSSCTTSNQCTLCNTGFYYKQNWDGLGNNICTNTCGESFFQDVNNQQCIRCPISNCKVCISTTDTGCISCLPSIAQTVSDSMNNVCTSTTCSLYLQQQRQCLIQCLPGYYKNIDFTCSICDNACKQCQDTAAACTECYPNMYLQYTIGQQVKGSCIPECQTTFYQKPSLTPTVSGGICASCHPTCKDCTDDLETSCISCSAGRFLLNKRCLTSCGENAGYVANTDLNRCDQCAANCTSCTSISAQRCTKCAITHFFLQNQCLAQCPSGYYGDSNKVCQACNSSCLTCDGPQENNCLSCGASIFYLASTKRCTTLCPDKFYGKTDTFICESCINGCLKCINPFDCQYCDENFFLNTLNSINNCLAVCPDGYFGAVTARACRQCDPGCKTCKGSTQSDCIICSAGRFNYMGDCIATCPAGTFLDTVNMRCDTCSQGCSTCTAIGMGNCTTCEFGYLFYNKGCYITCPTGSYKTGTTCTSCISNCSVCNDSISCQRCNDSTFYTGILCTTSCLSNQYGDTLTRTCKQCDPSCLTCSGAKIDNCLSCNTTFLFSNSCNQYCPDGYYADTSTKTCRNCISTCVTCLNPTSCSSCTQGSFLTGNPPLCQTSCPAGFYGDSGTRACRSCFAGCRTCFGTTADKCQSCLASASPRLFYFNYSCNQTCPDGTYPNTSNSNCDSCHQFCGKCIDASAKCTQCTTNRFMSPLSVDVNSPCITVCPYQYYGDQITRTCLLCATNCRSCTSSSANSCTACMNTNINDYQTNYYLSQNSCVTQCPSQLVVNQDGSSTEQQLYGDIVSDPLSYNCVSKCPPLTYRNNSIMVCEQCHISCRSCEGKLSNQCLACFPGFYLYQGTCSSGCPSGTYLYSVTSSCITCNSKCKECDGPNATDCTECSAPLVKQGRECLDSCIEGYVVVDQVCVSCHYTCDQCIGNDIQECISCSLGLFLQKLQESDSSGKCLQNCNQNYYPDTIDNKCKLCHSTCITCQGSEENDCLSCSGSLMFMGGICSDTCIDGYYLNVNQCAQCNLSCKTCSGSSSNQCLSCSEQLFMFNSQCLISCIEGYFQNEIEHSCDKCLENCLTCTNGTTCNACDTSKFFLFEDYCYEYCASGFYFDTTQKICQSCNSLCGTCTGPESNQCLSCDTDYFLKVTKNSDTGIYDWTCEPQCGEFYSPDIQNFVCLFDTCDSTCSTCLNDQPTTCRSCNNSILSNSRCLDGCQDGYYVDNNLCIQCNRLCKTCKDSSTVCPLCVDVAYRVDDSYCVSTCPEKYIKHATQPLCIGCVPNCQNCVYDEKLVGSTKCLKCESSFFIDQTYNSSKVLINVQCYQTCPDGKYNNLDSYQCTNCDWTCKTCSDATSLDCIKCGTVVHPKTGVTQIRYMEDGICKITCQAGSYAHIDSINGNTCLICNSTCKTCSGILDTNCSSCYSTTYLAANGKCVKDCSIGYFSNDSNQRCEKCYQGCSKCDGVKSTQCLACENGYYLYKDTCQTDCPDEYFKDGNICSNCDKFCYNCTGKEPDQCISCPTDLYFYPQQNTCYIECPLKSFLNPSTFQCQECHPSCLTCSNEIEDSCLSCPQKETDTEIQTYLLNGKCISDCGTHKFGDPDSLTCEECSIQCISCQTKSNNCTGSCPANRLTIPQCDCPSGYLIDSPNAECEQCYYKCSTCKEAFINCLKCAANRNQDAPFCSCPPGYFDDEENKNPICQPCAWQCSTCQRRSDICITCKGDRVGQSCVCPAGKYEDSSAQKEMCSTCDPTCSTCAVKANYCITCKGNRYSTILPDNPIYKLCLCQNGLFEDGKSTNCPQCDFKCTTCTSSSSNCLSCRGDRILTEQCTCESGYFDDDVNDKCQKCDLQCVTCDKKGCLTCAGNREGPDILKICNCPATGIDRRQHGYSECGTCEYGVPYVKMKDSLDSMTINLGGVIAIKGINDPTIPSREVCQKLFNDDDFAKLGSGKPLCNVDPNNQKQVIVVFGNNAQFLIGNTITLNLKSVIGRKDCQSIFYTNFLAAKINGPDVPAAAYVKFTGPQFSNLCSKIIFFPSQVFNDGGRGLTMKSWSIVSIEPDNSGVRGRIQVLFDAANAAKNNKIEIPPLMLSEYSKYVFKYTFTNFLNTEFSSDYTVSTTTYESPFVSIEELSPHVYYTNARIKLVGTIIHQSCLTGTTEIIASTINYEWISNKVSKGDVESYLLQDVTTLAGVKSPDVQFIQLDIPPYSGKGGYSYEVTLIATLTTKPISSNYTVDITLLNQGLQVEIEGGNRMNGYAVPLKVNGWAKDPNIKTDQSVGIELVWKCVNLNTNLPCADVYDEEIPLNRTNSQFIAAKRLVPYNAYNFYLNGTKEELFEVAQAVIVIVELDIPVLELKRPEYLTSKRVNMNQEISIKFLYPTKNPDSLYYGGAIVYDFNVVATLRFFFTSITIKFWDSFNDLTDLAQLGFRASVYNPQFFMPSTTTLLININLPPRSCKMNVSPTSGISFDTQFTLKVTDCEDSDSPFTYKFTFYYSPTQYNNDVLKAASLNQILLLDYSIDNEISTILPNPLSDSAVTQPFLILMASISDSLGALTNLTSSVVVGLNQVDLRHRLQVAEYLKKRQQQEDKFYPLPYFFRSRQLAEITDATDKFIRLYQNRTTLSIPEQINLLNLLAIGVKDLSIDNPSADQDANETAIIQEEQTKLITLKKSILASLKELQSQDVSVATKSALTKSIEELMNDEDIQLNMSSENMDAELDKADSIVSSSTSGVSELQGDIESGNVDFKSFRIKENLQNDIMRTAGLLNGLLAAGQNQMDSIDSTSTTTSTNSTDSNNSTNETDAAWQKMKDNNAKLFKVQESVKFGLTQTADPNAPPKVFSGGSFSMKSSIATPSKMAEYLAGSDPTKSKKDIKITDDDESTQSDETNIQTVTYNQAEFADNPYATDDSFPSRSVPASVQNIEPKLPNGSVIVPKQPIPMSFGVTAAKQAARLRRLRRLYGRRNMQYYQDLYELDEEPESQAIFCIGKGSDGGWSAGGGNCKTVKQVDATGALTVTCQCEELSPTSVGDAIADALAFDKFAKAFSMEALLALLNFPFYKSVIVYALAFMTTALVFSVKYGFKKDREDVEKKLLAPHFVESEYIRIKAEENQAQRSEKQKLKMQKQKEIEQKLQEEYEEQLRLQQEQQKENEEQQNNPDRPINTSLQFPLQEEAPVDIFMVQPDIEPEELMKIRQMNEIKEEQNANAPLKSEPTYKSDSDDSDRPPNQVVYDEEDSENSDNMESLYEVPENILDQKSGEKQKEPEIAKYFKQLEPEFSKSSMSVATIKQKSVSNQQQQQQSQQQKSQSQQQSQILQDEQQQQLKSESIADLEQFNQELEKQFQQQGQQQQQQQKYGEQQLQYDMGDSQQYELHPELKESPIMNKRDNVTPPFCQELQSNDLPHLQDDDGCALSAIKVTDINQPVPNIEEDSFEKDVKEAGQSEIIEPKQKKKSSTRKRKRNKNKVNEKDKDKAIDALDISNEEDNLKEEPEPTYEIKEQLVQQWHRDYKRKKFLESGCQLKFSLANVLLFMALFHKLLCIFLVFERRLPRPIRFCVLYMTILNTCYINIFFQVPLEPLQSIIFSVFSAILSNFEMFVILFLMPHKVFVVRQIGWGIFIALTTLLIYFILIAMALEAADSGGDITRSNMWGLNFIIGFMNTHCVSDPIKLLIVFKAVQLSLSGATGLLQTILVKIFVNPATNIFFEMIEV